MEPFSGGGGERVGGLAERTPLMDNPKHSPSFWQSETKSWHWEAITELILHQVMKQNAVINQSMVTRSTSNSLDF